MDSHPELDVDFTYIFYSLFDFNDQLSAKWMEKYWWTSCIFAAFYLLLIYVGQRRMQNRPSYNLHVPLVVWNSCLAIFSFVGSYKFIRFIYRTWTKHGFQGTVCMKPSLLLNQVEMEEIGHWAQLYALSKIVELGDTAFIVLRKRQLVFLHWYHHITVLVYTWYSLSDLAATCIWFTTVNLMVHAVMYTYFALTAAKFRIPRAVAMGITLGQISQMVVGLYVNWCAYGALSRGERCDVEYRNIASSIIMYASYWILFAHLFNVNYVKQQWQKKRN